MKTKCFFILIGLFPLMLVLRSCPLFHEKLEPTDVEFCDDKSILKFSSLLALSLEHGDLREEYFDRDEDEKVLINYENLYHHYSLRKKDNDIPSAQDTAASQNYKAFTAILNQDGMLILEEELYIYIYDGCIYCTTDYSCENYKAMIEYRNLLIEYNTNPSVKLLREIRDIRNEYDISEDECYVLELENESDY